MGLNIFGKIFGSDSVIDAGIRAIDAAVFTNEEKSKAKLELLKAYEPFKIAQRYLALIFAGNFSLAFITCLILVAFDKPYKAILEVVAAFSLGEIVLTVVAFYFLGGALSGSSLGSKK